MKKAKRQFIVGAYAASPCIDGWSATLESEFYKTFRNDPRILGIEYPFYGKIHRHDPNWVWQNLNPEWEIILTCIPGTMDRLRQDPLFGLASNEMDSRLNALEFAHEAHKSVNKFKEKGYKVRAVQFQSAPRQINGTEASKKNFENSLAHILKWDWGHTRVLIEHCDAWKENQKPTKGFLKLSDEIEALKLVSNADSKSIGITINWGRSAIEARSAQGPHEHILVSKKEGVLSGLMFSGAVAEDPLYGQWLDTHAPIAELENLFKTKNSLLNKQEIKKCLQLAGELNFVGFKMQPLPKTVSIEERGQLILKMLDALEEA